MTIKKRLKFNVEEDFELKDLINLKIRSTYRFKWNKFHSIQWNVFLPQSLSIKYTFCLIVVTALNLFYALSYKPLFSRLLYRFIFEP